MTAKVKNPMLRREQMAEQLRKSKRQELISKKRYPQLSEIAEELEDFNRKLEFHEQRLYGPHVQEKTDFDGECQGALQQPT